MKKILSLIVLGSIFASDLSYCMQEEESPYEQRLKNRVEKWKENSKKADLMVRCIESIHNDGTALVLPNLKIRKAGWLYKISSDGRMYKDYDDPGYESIPEPVLDEIHNLYIIERDSTKFTVRITPESSSQPWVNVEINENDTNGDVKTINIGWKQKEGLLIVHGADLDGSCAFGGRYVHMVDGKESSSDGSKPNEFPGGLTVFATHGFINFSPLYFKPDSVHIISPSSVNYGLMTNTFNTYYGMTPSLIRYTAFSAKYSDLLNNWVACHKGFHDFGKIDVAGSHVYLEDLPSYIAGSFIAKSVTMNGENNFLQFGDSDFKNVMLNARNQYFDPKVRNEVADYDSGRYEVKIGELNGVERVYIPSDWQSQKQSGNCLITGNSGDIAIGSDVDINNITELNKPLSAGDSSKWFKNKLYWDDKMGFLAPIGEALKKNEYRSLDNETICTAGLYTSHKTKGNVNERGHLSRDIILNAIDANGKFDCCLGISGSSIKGIKCKITKTNDSNTINVCLENKDYSKLKDPELNNFGYDLCLNLIKRILNNDNSLKSPFYVMNNNGGVYSSDVARYLLEGDTLKSNIEIVKDFMDRGILKLKLGKTTVGDREYLTEFKPLEKSDILHNEFLARVYFDFGNEKDNQDIYAMTIRCVIAPDGKVYAGEYRTGAPLTEWATKWLAGSLSSLKVGETDQENGFEQRKIILEKALEKGKISLKTEDGLKYEDAVGEKQKVSHNKWMELAEQHRMYATILAKPDAESKAVAIPIWFKATDDNFNCIFFDSTSGQPFNAWTDKRLSWMKIINLANDLFKQQPAVKPQEQPQPDAEEKEDKKDVAPQEQPQPNTGEEEDKKDVKKPSQKPIHVKHFEVKISDIMPQGGRMMNIKDNY